MSLSIGLISGCLIWIPISIGIISLVGWMIQGEVDVLAGVIGIAAALVLGGLALVSKNQEMAPYLFIGSVSILVLFPFAKAAHERALLASVDAERLEKAFAMLDKHRDNVGARLQVARILQSRGLEGQAIALAEETLQKLSDSVFAEEVRMVRQWKRISPHAEARETACMNCGAKNKPGEPFCHNCDAPVLLHYAKRQWANPMLLRRVLFLWLAAIILIVGVPMAGLNLPPNKSAAAVVLLLGMSALVVGIAIRSGQRRVG